MKDYSLKINGHNYNVQIDDVNEASTVAHVVVNGVDYEVEIEGAKASTATPSPRIAPAPSTSGSSVKCPLPGTVLSVKVAVGDTVAAGQTLVVLEAMKMENNIDADRAGVVKQILVQQGATVMEGDVLIVIG